MADKRCKVLSRLAENCFSYAIYTMANLCYIEPMGIKVHRTYVT